MPAFVILHHLLPADHARPTHWDLMLQQPDRDALRTWALTDEPRLNAAIEATKLADHRASYLDYEGPVSGNRGEVRRWDAGTYREISASHEGAESIEFVLEGAKFKATVTARQIDADAQRWIFNFA